jgi:type IV pilus assembly protein PilM
MVLVFELFKNKHRSILGIDISSTSVKILQLSMMGNHYCVEGYGRAILPDNAMDGNVIKDMEVVAKSIKHVLATSGLSCKQAACAVPDSSVISKVIQVNDGLSEQELEEFIMVEAEKYIPYPIDEVNIDFNVLGTSSKNSALIDVLIIASRSENVTNRADVIKLAGLEPVIVDVESYVVERAAQLMKEELLSGGEKKNIAIIDVGAKYTHLFVLHGMKIIFSREDEFGGNQMIDTAVERYGMTRPAVIDAINTGSLPEDYSEAIINPFNESVLLQMKRALQFFFSTTHYTFVDQILLAGGVAMQSGIAQLLQDQINIPTSIANPLAHMSFGKAVDRESLIQDSPLLMVACGLALRQIE